MHIRAADATGTEADTHHAVGQLGRDVRGPLEDRAQGRALTANAVDLGVRERKPLEPVGRTGKQEPLDVVGRLGLDLD